MGWLNKTLFGLGADQGKKLLKSETVMGSKSRLEKFKTLSRRQKKTLDKILGRVSPQSFSLAKNSVYQTGANYLQDFLKRGFSPYYNAEEMLGAQEAPMMRQFNEQIVPDIATRFSGLDARNSSAFNQTMAAAGTGLQERLAALRVQAQQDLGQQQAQYYQQQLQGAQLGLPYAEAPGQMSLNLAQLGLGTPAFGYQNIQGQPGLIHGLAGGVGRAAGAAMGGGMM